MGNPRVSRPNPIREQLEAARQLDRRRQQQVVNQRDSITRLLALNEVGPDPEAATREIARLNEELAKAQLERDNAREALQFMVTCYNEDPERLSHAADLALEVLA